MSIKVDNQHLLARLDVGFNEMRDYFKQILEYMNKSPQSHEKHEVLEVQAVKALSKEDLTNFCMPSEDHQIMSSTIVESVEGDDSRTDPPVDTEYGDPVEKNLRSKLKIQRSTTISRQPMNDDTDAMFF